MSAEGLLERELPGLRQRLLADVRGEIIVNRISPGAQLPEHAHPESQFGFALRGSFLLFGSFGSWTIDDRHAYLLAPNDAHGARNDGAAPVYTIDVKRHLSAGTTLAGVRFGSVSDDDPRCAGRYEGAWFSVRWLRLAAGDGPAMLRLRGDGARVVLAGDLDGPATIRPLDAPVDPRVGREPIEAIEIVYR